MLFNYEKKILDKLEPIFEFMRLNEEEYDDEEENTGEVEWTEQQKKWYGILTKFRLIYAVYIRIMLLIFVIIVVRLISGEDYTLYFLKGRYLVDVMMIWLQEYMVATILRVLIEWRIGKKLQNK